MAESTESAIKVFTDLLKFETVSSAGHLNGAYDACAQYILAHFLHLGTQTTAMTALVLPESKSNKPIVCVEWLGSDPSLPCLFWNSHYDVVPIMPEHWTVPAFDAHRQDGRIYGRGAQDMKSVCAQYMVAIAALVEEGFVPNRTFRLSFVPDEEISGAHGMGILLASDWFKAHKIAIAFDEGLANEGSDYCVFYGERLPWWVNVIAEGSTGHASRFIDGTASEMILSVVNKAMSFRQDQRRELHGGSHPAGCSHSVAAKTIGDVTSLNLSMIRSGNRGDLPEESAYNVIPVRMEAAFDIRISPFMSPQEMSSLLDKWCEEVCDEVEGIPEGGGVRWEYHQGRDQQAHASTSIDPLQNPWWEAFINILHERFGRKCDPMVFPAATDSRFLRAEGIRAIGFSPMRRSPCLLHEHDEYLDESVYVEGCEVYSVLMRDLGSLGRLAVDDMDEAAALLLPEVITKVR